MSDSLIVKPKTEIATQSKEKDILEFYGVPAMLDRIVDKERVNLLNALGCGAVLTDALNGLAHSEDFLVDIPGGLREMLRKGMASFDHSTKNPGAFTPNIRIEGSNGISGQATIVEKADPQVVTQSLSNLAMMAMVQSVMAKLDVIGEKLDAVKKGQENDRVGTIIGSFKSFMDLYPTFKTQEQLSREASTAYHSMQIGLAQLHLQIDEERHKLVGAPGDWWQVVKIAFKSFFKNPLRNKTMDYEKTYSSYVYNIQLYNRLILLADVILYLTGEKDAISRNHKIMVEYCNHYLDDRFKGTMDYLMSGETKGISNILNFNDNLALALDGYNNSDLKIECRQEDVKYLNSSQDETT